MVDYFKKPLKVKNYGKCTGCLRFTSFTGRRRSCVLQFLDISSPGPHRIAHVFKLSLFCYVYKKKTIKIWIILASLFKKMTWERKSLLISLSNFKRCLFSAWLIKGETPRSVNELEDWISRQNVNKAQNCLMEKLGKNV